MDANHESPDRNQPSTLPLWLNRNLLGMGLASLLSDFGHEMATAILPLFIVAVGASPAALGLIEGISDGAATFAKAAGGRMADRVGVRHKVASLGYLITGLATGSFALAQSWVELLLARTVGWMAKGARGPCRDNLLVESVPRSKIGAAFGFHRFADTIGAILGPLAAMFLLPRVGFRNVFLISLVPGILSGTAFFIVVRESNGEPGERKPFAGWAAAAPPHFRRFLLAIGVFGAGDFAHSMLILRAADLMGSSAKAMSVAIGLYVVHNVAHALLDYPIGALGDRYPRRKLLAAAFAIDVIATIGFAIGPTTLAPLTGLFVLEGLVMAASETLGSAVATDLLPDDLRGTGFGILASVNGIGDLISSVVVGLLWSHVSAGAAFGYGAVMSAIGAALLFMAV
ncbi:MAG TPA: MFS transporter [Candidatus Binataceae bacterium]|nr:MFS transporter [Candidatus Binataceae bacterium]